MTTRSMDMVPAFNRRGFLKAGAVPLLGIGLADVLRAEAHGGTADKQARSVLFVFLSGGPPHIDLWDMKPNAPAEIRGEFRAVDTVTPGIQLCEHLPLLSKHTDKLALLRSLAHQSNNHEISTYMLLTLFGGQPQLGVGNDH